MAGFGSNVNIVYMNVSDRFTFTFQMTKCYCYEHHAETRQYDTSQRLHHTKISTSSCTISNYTTFIYLSQPRMQVVKFINFNL